jgi:hypothetical protein
MVLAILDPKIQADSLGPVSATHTPLASVSPLSATHTEKGGGGAMTILKLSIFCRLIGTFRNIGRSQRAEGGK